ncbi:MAG TPA: CCA tRNA nucleotidyltransferase [Rhizomicrobium sp.]|jgi:poly(A) polymerase
MIRKLNPARETWMRTNETSAIMDALDASQGSARFVGGAVRNALLGRKVQDIDIATVFLPEDVILRLESAGIKAVPTGIEHGTVTAVFDGKAFEVTTLRRDVATDGRHATVAFSDSWSLDAQRRDFTINALYASPDGEIFDYTGGLGDLDTRRVRFIGDPVARIREDYLRILRLFRFHAWYGLGEIDGEALAAARAERAGLRRLSGERIRNEILRLLEAENPCPAVRAMTEAGILREIIHCETRSARLDRLVHIGAENLMDADPVLRLAALLPDDAGVASAFTERLRFSRENRDRLVELVVARENLRPSLPDCELRAMLYRLGTRRVQDRIFLCWADDPDDSHANAWRSLLSIADAWTPPRFPLTGADVMAEGIPEGPLVGKVLSELEAWWVVNDFAPDRAALRERLKKVGKTATE